MLWHSTRKFPVNSRQPFQADWRKEPFLFLCLSLCSWMLTDTFRKSSKGKQLSSPFSGQSTRPIRSGSQLLRCSGCLEVGFNRGYKGINPSYPTYNRGYNLLAKLVLSWLNMLWGPCHRSHDRLSPGCCRCGGISGCCAARPPASPHLDVDGTRKNGVLVYIRPISMQSDRNLKNGF